MRSEFSLKTVIFVTDFLLVNTCILTSINMYVHFIQIIIV